MKKLLAILLCLLLPLAGCGRGGEPQESEPAREESQEERPADREMNLYQVLNERSSQIKMLVLSLVAPEDILADIASMASVTVSRADYSVGRYLDAWDATVLSTLEVLDMGYVMPRQQRSAAHQDNTKRAAATYGADELEEWLVHLRCDGKEYATGVQLLRYGDHWRIYSLQSNLLGQSALCLAFPIDGAAAFSALLEGDYQEPGPDRESATGSTGDYVHLYLGLLAPDTDSGQALADGFMEGVEMLGSDCVRMTATNDIAQQISNIENMVAQGVELILLFPGHSDPYALQPVVELCHDAGVLVILVDSGIPGMTPGEDYTCLVYLESYEPAESGLYLLEIAAEFLMGSQLSPEITL